MRPSVYTALCQMMKSFTLETDVGVESVSGRSAVFGINTSKKGQVEDEDHCMDEGQLKVNNKNIVKKFKE